jgi:DNA-binding transcriptional LysR family regulator
MPDINWNAVYGFWLVAEHGSFAAAARSLPRGSVQALQKRVRGLEKKHNLNLRLLRSRGAKGVELTEAGRRLYELLNPVFESFDALAGELRDEASGPLTVAMSTSSRRGKRTSESVLRRWAPVR